ncbi:MAG: DNA gyrase subunit A, partial [Clostridiales bacterium]|nr:DNA gyrase subunit A [Clostridiales bacterium]
RTLTGEYSLQSRGGYGNRNYNITDKTGPVVGSAIVNDSDDVLLISDDGTIIRMSASGISTYGRVARGVRLMNVEEGCKVIALAKTKMDENGDVAEANLQDNSEKDAD